MLVARSMHPDWLSNSWLIADRPGGKAVLVDSGGPMDSIVQAIREHRLELSHVLCTHHHYDHVHHNSDYKQEFGCQVCGHHAEAQQFGHLDLELADGDEIRVGELAIRALHIPGHTAGQLAFLVDENCLLTGDTLFRESVGGTRAPGHTSFEDLQHSVMDTLFGLPHSLRVLPGHMGETSLAHEWEHNPFVRAWRGLDTPSNEPVWAYEQAAFLLLRARDYDGGTKCWVRFAADQRLDLVPGSRVRPRDSSLPA